MSESFGPGVSRVLSAYAQQFTTVVWQADKPPLDSELNLMSQVDWEALSQTVRSQVHSGFFLDPTRCEADYVTDPLNANQFLLSAPGTGEFAPVLFASVNGWVVPVFGVNGQDPDPDVPTNRVLLAPPPSTDSRTDFVFLEVWRALVAPNPSTTNKPNAAELWKYGNTQYNGTNLTDQIEDPAVGFETTKRVQLQYRIRVVGSGDGLGTSVDLKTFPDGMDSPVVLGQGTAGAPVPGVFFKNARLNDGDPSLWIAGDGDPSNALGTVDGFVYAVAICAVFRRNTGTFTAIATGGTPNQNGAANRVPSGTTPANSAVLLAQATLITDLSETQTSWVTLNSYVGSGLDDPNLFPIGTTRRYLVIGTGINREVIAINANIDPLGHPSDIFVDLAGRGRAGTMARQHPTGTAVSLYNARPDGLYADQIAASDILDMRRSVNFGDWDYTRLLQKGVAALIQNNLRTTFKTSGTGGNTVGPVTTEVSLFTAAIPPNHVGPVDGANAIRTIWSDSAAFQSDVTVILNDQAALNPTNNVTSNTFSTGIAPSWSIAADFQPNGFLNIGTGGTQGWTNGTVIFVDIGGANGIQGAREGLLNVQPAVRFLAPYEAWKPGDNELYSHHPWALRFLGGVTGNSETVGTPEAINAYKAGFITTSALSADPSFDPVILNHPGPMFPLASSNFERPFIVLGGVVRSDLRFVGVLPTSANLINVSPTKFEVNFPSVDWDTYTDLLGSRDQATLRDYLTNYGQDYTGLSSKLYLVIYGDPKFRDNGGAFQVIGAGTLSVAGGSYTQNVAFTKFRLVVRPLSADFDSFQNNATGDTVTIEFRSQQINAEDDSGSTNPPQGVAVVLTDLRATFSVRYPTSTPWGNVDAAYLLDNDGGTPDRLIPVSSKATLTMDLLWGANRGASQRVPDRVSRFGAQNVPASFVRRPVSVVDPVFVADTGYPSGDDVFEPNQLQLWNRLPSRGLAAPFAAAYGGEVVGLTEQDREAELFVDPGSKTAVFRPFAKNTLILKGMSVTDAVYSSTVQPQVAATTLLGPVNYQTAPPYNFPKDGHALFTSTLTEAYLIPPEFMPRFGRQDIPYHTYTGAADPVYPGFNHLFADGPGTVADAFFVIGGADNLGSAQVLSILMDTDLPPVGGVSYGVSGTTGGAPHQSYGARKTFLANVVSSDLGAGMWGVELPPYMGIARLYGVYERQDFLDHRDGVNVGAFLNGDRTTPIVGGGLPARPPVNLLRTDGVKQTLFIRQGGGNDVTQLEHSHTYLVPDSALDLTLVPAPYSVGINGTFDDYHYVVECVIFGFAEGFIDQNHYVLARLHGGTGATVTSTSNRELGAVGTILPSPPPPVAPPYEVYQRTVYQGDPFMTRDGATAQAADYGTRYGQILQSEAFGLQNSVTPQSAVEVPNPRAFEVLATMDFYTTLGTGKIGGLLYENTFTDCGVISPASGSATFGPRVPDTSSQLPWRWVPRAFTEGQNDNPTHARATVQILDAVSATLASLQVTVTVGGVAHSLTCPADFAGISASLMADSLTTAINNPGNGMSSLVRAQVNGTVVTVVSLSPGAQGNSSTLAITLALPTLGTNLIAVATVQTAQTFARTFVNFDGGVDIPQNGGDGNSVVSLTGMTERLPMGILASDSDFVTENILGDGATSLRSYQGSLRAVYAAVPLTTDGFEYNRFTGEPGTILESCDGAILQYTAYTPTTLAGSKKFRLFRGGGASFVLSGIAPGGPVTWVSDSFAAAVQPVVKGAVLACKAILVRNYVENAFTIANQRSAGDEIQLVILTQAVYGQPDTTQDGITLSGIISPTGYGEGYAAADRFLIPGRPMDRGRSRTTPSLLTIPAPYYRVT